MLRGGNFAQGGGGGGESQGAPLCMHHWLMRDFIGLLSNFSTHILISNLVKDIDE